MKKEWVRCFSHAKLEDVEQREKDQANLWLTKVTIYRLFALSGK